VKSRGNTIIYPPNDFVNNTGDNETNPNINPNKPDGNNITDSKSPIDKDILNNKDESKPRPNNDDSNIIPWIVSIISIVLIVIFFYIIFPLFLKNKKDDRKLKK
jgi:hypothetical protein